MKYRVENLWYQREGSKECLSGLNAGNFKNIYFKKI